MKDKKSSSQDFYQTVNFHFRVEFVVDMEAIDVRFQSVTGLDSTLDTETIKEGGENRFEHVIPVRRKYGPLILKRGLIAPTSKWSEWLKKVFDDGQVTPLSSLQISLLNAEHDTLMYWLITNVWPRSWKIGELNAERGEVLIETLELNYNTLTFNQK